MTQDQRPTQAAGSPATQTGSLNPDHARTSGGFLDDADITIESLRYVIFDFNGRGMPRLCLRLGLTEGPAEHLPIGWVTDYVPSDDGTRAVAVSDKAGKFRADSPGMRFIASAVESGFPKERLSDDASVFDGLACHVTRVKDDNYKPKPGAPAPKRPPSVLLVTRINALPGAPTPESETLTPVEVKARDVVSKLTKQTGTLARKDLFQGIMRELSADPDLNAVVQVAYSEAFLSRDDQPWSYDAQTETVTELEDVPF